MLKELGPKNALKLVKEHKTAQEVFKHVEWNHDASWQEVYDTIKKMPTTDDYVLEWKDIDEDALAKLLIEEFEFSKERVERGLKNLVKEKTKRAQKSLGDF